MCWIEFAELIREAAGFPEAGVSRWVPLIPWEVERGGHMYWWNLKELKSELSQGTLAQPEAFKYVLAQSICAALAIGGAPSETALRWAPLAYAVLAGCGVAHCYRRNGAARGSDFVSRLISLGWVVGIRVAVAWFAIALVVGIAVAFWMASQAEKTAQMTVDLVKTLLGLAAVAFVCWRIGTHMADLRQGPTAPVAPEMASQAL